MARLNEILVGRFNRSLQKVFAIKGGPPVATLAPEIMPIHSIFKGVESRYLESWNEFMFSGQFLSNAAQICTTRLNNPAGSNVVAVVEDIFATLTVADINFQYHFGVGSVFGSTFGPIRLDARQGANVSSVCRVSAQSGGVTALTPIATTPLPTINTAFAFKLIEHEDQEIPLLPGDAIQMVTNSVQVQQNFVFRWRERFLEDSERT